MTAGAPPPAAVEAAMDRALQLAARTGGRTSPNPMVGAVALAPDGAPIAEGWHAAPGAAHAEVALLEDARARGVDLCGATLVLNLEPCTHHGRTPPCAPRVVAAGFARAVVGAPDPNPVVSGRGLAALAAAGLEVTTGVHAAAAARLNEGYCRWITTGRPFVHLKVAMLPDGTVRQGGELPRWISGPAARARVHRWRHLSAAVLIGGATVRADDPLLTVRDPEDGHDFAEWQPRRVVLSADLSVPPEALVLRPVTDGPRTLVIGAPDADPRREERLRGAGGEVVRVPRAAGGVDLSSVLELLGREGVSSVLVEGGPTLSDALLAAGLVDRLSIFVAGGDRPLPAGGARDEPGAAADGPVRWIPPGGLPFSGAGLDDLERTPLGGDLLISGLLRP